MIHTLVVSDCGEQQLGLWAKGGDHLLDLASSLLLGPAVYEAGSFLWLRVSQTLNVTPKLGLDQVLVSWRHLVGLGGEDGHPLLQV